MGLWHLAKQARVSNAVAIACYQRAVAVFDSGSIREGLDKAAAATEFELQAPGPATKAVGGPVCMAIPRVRRRP